MYCVVYLNEPNFLIRGCKVTLYDFQSMSQSDTNFSAKSSILQTSEIFTIVYTNAIDDVILDLQTKAVKMNKHGSFFVNSSDNPRGYYYEAFAYGFFLGSFDFKSDADEAVYSEYVKTEIKAGRW